MWRFSFAEWYQLIPFYDVCYGSRTDCDSKIWCRIIQQNLICGWWQQTWDIDTSFISWQRFVSKCRFECLKHSETKQVKCQHLEQRNVTVRPSKENWRLMLKIPWTLWCFSQSFHRQSLGQRATGVCDFLLIGWWWGNKAVFQESCAQLEVTIHHLDGGLSSSRRTQRYCYAYYFRRNQDPGPLLH